MGQRIHRNSKENELPAPVQPAVALHATSEPPQAAGEPVLGHDFSQIRVHAEQHAPSHIGSLLPVRVAQAPILQRAPTAQPGWTSGVASGGATSREPGVTPPTAKGWNQDQQTIGKMLRIPVDGLTTANPAHDKDSHTDESPVQRAIVIIPETAPDKLLAGKVDVLLHLHGHGTGFRQRNDNGGAGKGKGSVRDIDFDHLEQQLEASKRRMIGVLAQGTNRSVFGTGAAGEFADADAYLNEIFSKIKAMKLVADDAAPGRVVLSAHSGGGIATLNMMMRNALPTGVREVVLMDAIHGDIWKVQAWVTKQLDNDRDALAQIATDAAAAGTDPLAAQRTYLDNSMRLRGYHTSKNKGNRYAERYGMLNDTIKAWFKRNEAKLGGASSDIYTKLRANYTVIDVGHTDHDGIIGKNMVPKKGENSATSTDRPVEESLKGLP